MSQRHSRYLFAALIALASFATVRAAVPAFWQVSTQSDFLKGEVENLSIDAHGRLLLGPSGTAVYESSAPFLWAMVAAPDGTIYTGSGNEGQVFRIDAAGKGSVFFDAEELAVHALALAPKGGIYVGTSPDGKIYKVDAKGAGTVLFDPPDKYIWSLAVDRTGNVYAATGDKGVVYKITPDGKGTPLYETKATHAISLAFDREGRLLVGTESPGRVFQIDAGGKPFVLLDSPFNEIHALRVDPNGVIYAAALSGRTASPDDRGPGRVTPEPTPQTAVPSVSTEITAISIADVSVTTTQTPAPPRPAQGTGAGAIYRITPDGAWDQVWESREDAPYDIGFEADGSLFVATGNKGKIFRLSGDPLQATLVTRASAQQVTTVLRDRAGAMLYTTANPGKVFRLSPTRADRGTYDSEVRDAQTVATWGSIRWHAVVPGGGRVEIFTRSGNTRTPDDTWSAWAGPYPNPDGSPITSPRARYLQWRAVLTSGRGESPLVTSVTAAYLQRNLRPQVSSITIHPPGTVFQKPFSTGELEIAGYDGELPERRMTQPAAPSTNPNPGGPSLGRRAYQKGLLTFVWRADDDNNDDLLYDVLYRREGETSWKTLKRALSDPILVWDTTSVPNGTYQLRVVASDAPSNPQGTALSGHMDSTSFDIDNSPPTISVTAVRRDAGRTIVSFDVKDDQSAVQKVEYSLEGDRWRTIYPKDGIADSRSEQFELVLDGDTEARSVVIRATDALNNVASARGEAPSSSR